MVRPELFFFVWGLEPKSPKKNASPGFFKKAYFTNLIKIGPELENKVPRN